jgi:hypothetical protein
MSGSSPFGSETCGELNQGWTNAHWVNDLEPKALDAVKLLFLDDIVTGQVEESVANAPNRLVERKPVDEVFEADRRVEGAGIP